MAKTKALISFAVTAKLICVFVFAYAKGRFSHDAAHLFHAINRAYFDVELFRAFEKISQCLLCDGLAQLVEPRTLGRGVPDAFSKSHCVYMCMTFVLCS